MRVRKRKQRDGEGINNKNAAGDRYEKEIGLRVRRERGRRRPVYKARVTGKAIPLIVPAGPLSGHCETSMSLNGIVST